MTEENLKLFVEQYNSFQEDIEKYKKLDNKRAIHAAMVDELDQAIGQIHQHGIVPKVSQTVTEILKILQELKNKQNLLLFKQRLRVNIILCRGNLFLL